MGRNCFWITEQYTPDETNGVSNAVSCYKEAVQFSASFVMSLFASCDEICGIIYIFFGGVTLITRKFS